MDLETIDEFDRLLYVCIVTSKNKISDDERIAIEVDTRLQSESSDWMTHRQTRLTASMIHSVITAVNTAKTQTRLPSAAVAIRQIEPIDLTHIPAIQRGRECEPMAFATTCRDHQHLALRTCGIFIDTERPFLAASPDGISSDGQTIIEIKAPNIEREVAFWDADRKLKRTHQYYTQIQYQLHVTKAKKCIFAVFINENENNYEDILYDETFIGNTISKVDLYYRKVFCTVYCIKKNINPRTIQQVLVNLFNEKKKIRIKK